MVAATACSRTDLLPSEIGDPAAFDEEAGAEPGFDSGQVGVDQEMPPDPPDSRPVPPTPDSSPSICEPQEEECNGVDDDCNGEIDEVAPVKCPGGGYSYCVGGSFTKCPQRCEACIPGSVRICQLNYCLYWGTQSCTADGRSFSICHEQTPPKECAEIAKRDKNSPELEQCCIDNGYCCVDYFDLDGDGIKNEQIGRCDDVSCTD